MQSLLASQDFGTQHFRVPTRLASSARRQRVTSKSHNRKTSVEGTTIAASSPMDPTRALHVASVGTGAKVERQCAVTGDRALLTGTAPSTCTVGFWSAVAATACSVIYDVAQIAEWLGWLGSRGGAESSSTPLGIIVLLTPSLLLGSAFLLLMVSVHQLAPLDRRVWSHAAVAFATVYTALISINYFVQLAWVGPRLARGQIAGMESFLFTPFDSFLYAVDILGYSFMSLATLAAAQVFTGGGLQRTARRFLFANGLLLPFIALQMYWHSLIWFAAAWAVTFPAATWSLALLFRRSTASP